MPASMPRSGVGGTADWHGFVSASRYWDVTPDLRGLRGLRGPQPLAPAIVDETYRAEVTAYRARMTEKHEQSGELLSVEHTASMLGKNGVCVSYVHTLVRKGILRSVELTIGRKGAIARFIFREDIEALRGKVRSGPKMTTNKEHSVGVTQAAINKRPNVCKWMGIACGYGCPLPVCVEDLYSVPKLGDQFYTKARVWNNELGNVVMLRDAVITWQRRELPQVCRAYLRGDVTEGERETLLCILETLEEAK